MKYKFFIDAHEQGGFVIKWTENPSPFKPKNGADDSPAPPDEPLPGPFASRVRLKRRR